MEPKHDVEPISRQQKPESAAIAGIVYALAAGASLFIIDSVPKGLDEEAWNTWVSDSSNLQSLYLALILATVSAVAFLWYVAVVRRRIGEREDKFFATVFFGSAVVYVSLWLVAASVVASPAVLDSLSGQSLTWDVYLLIEGLGGSLLVYAAPRIQAVFVASSSTMYLRTGVVPKWLGYLGLLLAVGMFFLPIVWTPIGLGMPAFVLITSIVVLLTRRTLPEETSPTS